MRLIDLEFHEGALVNRRYHILRHIGSGAVGEVFQAADLDIKSVVALKVFVSHGLLRQPIETAETLLLSAGQQVESAFDDPATMLERFKNEVAAARELYHPHIARIYDLALTPGGTHFFSMEYVDDGALTSRIPWKGNDRAFSFEETLIVLRDVASALDYTHSSGIVHRDLKPDNILLSRAGGAKVVDFGLARHTVSGFTQTADGRTVGTPFYMAPEQLQSSRVDGRADIYSLGIIAYELAAGARPFNSKNYLELAQMHICKEFPPLGEHSSYPFPRWFERFVRTCAAKHPDKRYQSMKLVVELLDEKLRKMGLIKPGDAKPRLGVRRAIARLLKLV